MRLFPQSRAAFAIPDLLGLLVVLAVAASLALAATRQMRQEAMSAAGLNQLRWIAGATGSYAADNGDQFWSYSWRAHEWYSFRGRMVVPTTDQNAAVYQALDTLDRLAGRFDIPWLWAWVPHALYNHLPLVDYLGRSLPDLAFVAPGDRHRLKWARDPEAFDRGEFLPFQPEPDDAGKRWPYSSSYHVSVGFWDRAESVSSRIYQAGVHWGWFGYDGRLGGAALADVTFPSQKVMLYDAEQRTLGANPVFFADSSARAAVLMADGSASVNATADSNLGWHPRFPTLSPPSGIMRFRYEPSPWEAPIGPGGEILTGHYRWTRGGIAGRDFGGPEIDTGQP